MNLTEREPSEEKEEVLDLGEEVLTTMGEVWVRVREGILVVVKEFFRMERGGEAVVVEGVWWW